MIDPLKIALLIIIGTVLLAITVFLLASIIRRVSRARMYRNLDRERALFRERLERTLDGKSVFSKIDYLMASPGSIKWQAIEDVLLDLIKDGRYKDDVTILVRELGYVSFYEDRLKSKNIIRRAQAIDKLGGMQSEPSTDKIISMLHSENPEVIAVAVRSLGKIGSTKGLNGILKRLPVLLKKSLITRKSTEASLIHFGPDNTSVLIKQGWEQDHPEIKSVILEVLSQLGSEEALPLATVNLQNPSPEVRAKSLKVIGTIAADVEDFDGDPVIPLLADQAWFVRLHAARVLGKIKYEKAAHILGGLLMDGNWQVRNEAATALTKMGNGAIDNFLKILRHEDRYAKESICEEIERTDFVHRLIENLDSRERDIYGPSREILETMCSLHFLTRCTEYLEKGENPKIREEISHILNDMTES